MCGLCFHFHLLEQIVRCRFFASLCECVRCQPQNEANGKTILETSWKLGCSPKTALVTELLTATLTRQIFLHFQSERSGRRALGGYSGILTA